MHDERYYSGRGLQQRAGQQREQEIREFLAAERLHVHPRKCWVQPVCVGTEYLGYRLWPRRRKLRADNGYKFRRRLCSMARCYARGRVDLEDICPRIAAWIGHAQHGQTQALRKCIFREQSFRRGNGPTTSCSARGFLVRLPSVPALRVPLRELR
jgi:hypothetical protein